MADSPADDAIAPAPPDSEVTVTLAASTSNASDVAEATTAAEAMTAADATEGPETVQSDSQPMQLASSGEVSADVEETADAAIDPSSTAALIAVSLHVLESACKPQCIVYSHSQLLRVYPRQKDFAWGFVDISVINQDFRQLGEHPENRPVLLPDLECEPQENSGRHFIMVGS